MSSKQAKLIFCIIARHIKPWFLFRKTKPLRLLNRFMK